jgi:hypothetical protein
MGQRAIATDVEDDVVALLVIGDVFPGVVDDVVGAEGSDRVDLRRAGHAGHDSSGRLGDLDGEGAHAAGCADDQDPVPGLHSTVLADGLEGGAPGDGNRRRLVEGDVGRLRGEFVRSHDRVLGERAGGHPEHLVARLEPAHVGAARLDGSGEAAAGIGVPGTTQTEAGEANGIGQTGHDVPRASIHAGREHAHQHLVVAEGGPVDLPEPENVLRCRAVPV